MPNTTITLETLFEQQAEFQKKEAEYQFKIQYLENAMRHCMMGSTRFDEPLFPNERIDNIQTTPEQPANLVSADLESLSQLFQEKTEQFQKKETEYQAKIECLENQINYHMGAREYLKEPLFSGETFLEIHEHHEGTANLCWHSLFSFEKPTPYAANNASATSQTNEPVAPKFL